ncbi:hypothetical protein AO727_15830 [Acinetobacter baumannii]|uniref:RelA/SpoT domain-containing protein n=1 Tax=Acinetobacter baumannii TaxID=470 RepID=UPI00071871E4|nr:RelA/SpoT domain-containing protein [Acinetobacter baumannii]KRW17056.1 hypothetical protein AO727_15830 [Acinetobacter baumannii]
MSILDEINISKTQVIKAGDMLINPEATDDQRAAALEIVSTWRSFHAKPLNTFQKYIRSRDICKKKNCIIAQRLKRLPSIVEKLERFNSIDLARMQDIGGIRVVVPSINDVYALHAEVLKKPNNRFLFTPKQPAKNYIENPKPDGYKSIHQVFEYKRDHEKNISGLYIELQLRTALQHAFATAVETLGMVERTSFKTGHGSDDFKRFFKLVSALFSHKEGTTVLEEYRKHSINDLIKEASDLEKSLQVFHKLQGIAITAKNIDSPKWSSKKYQLLELNKKDEGHWSIRISEFPESQLDLAETLYASLEKKYKNDPNMDVVLISVGDLKEIKRAYPNYFLDTNDFIAKLKGIFENGI